MSTGASPDTSDRSWELVEESSGHEALEDPTTRVEDARCAADFLTTLPFVDAERMGVFGVCAGGGLHFVADSDLVIASDNASFVDTHTAVGFVSACEPIGLARRIPFEAVMRLVLLGRARWSALTVGSAVRITAAATIACGCPKVTPIAFAYSESQDNECRHGRELCPGRDIL